MIETELTQRVTSAFKATRWPNDVHCMRCHSDQAVNPAPPSMPRPLGLDVYHCGQCRYAFSDLTGTVLEKTSRPLWLWAWLVLGGDPATITLPVGKFGSQRARLRDMAARLQDTALAADWKRQLRAMEIRAEQLAPLVEGWAAGNGNRPRGRYSAATKDPAHRRKAG